MTGAPALVTAVLVTAERRSAVCAEHMCTDCSKRRQSIMATQTAMPTTTLNNDDDDGDNNDRHFPFRSNFGSE